MQDRHIKPKLFLDKYMEVEDESVDGVLAPEFAAVKLPAAQSCPEFAFLVGHLLPQLPGAGEEDGRYAMGWLWVRHFRILVAIPPLNPPAVRRDCSPQWGGGVLSSI